MTEPIRVIRGDEVGFCFTIGPGLEEDQVWRVTSRIVTMGLDNDTERALKDVFDQYSSGENYDFSKTVVPLRLAKFGEEKLISRSQAKRALARVERFKAVVFDFAGIEMIGQAFADEVFRVWARAHEDVVCTLIDANPIVRKTIAAVGPAANVNC